MSLLHLEQAAESYVYVVPCMLKEAGTVKHQTIRQAYATVLVPHDETPAAGSLDC